LNIIIYLRLLSASFNVKPSTGQVRLHARPISGTTRIPEFRREDTAAKKECLKEGSKGRANESEDLTMNINWEASNAEPSLDEVLHDPIVRLLMQGDRTGESEVRQLIERVRTSLAVPVEAGGEGAGAPARKKKRSRKTRAA